MMTDQSTSEYTVRRWVAAPVSDVFACFVEPKGFAAWFVVPGFSTPAERVVMDPRPGGHVAAVMVPHDSGDEVPFTLTYLDVDAARSVRLRVGEGETVTLQVTPVSGGTDLSYTYSGPETTDGAVEAAELMLDHLMSYVERR
jgi:uncharacterized protein YndB with AHSA1/START domain